MAESTVQALVRLRIFLDDARERSRDASDAGQHGALIALDGAVEYALWLCAHDLGAAPAPNMTFHGLIKVVRECIDAAGESWAAPGAAGVDQLHRARNQAQHSAVAPRGDQLPRWADDAHAFVDSLLRSAFGIDIAHISLALAIRDPKLAALIASGERALATGDPEAAFSQAWTALEAARSQWRDQSHLRGARPVVSGRTNWVLNTAPDPLWERLDEVEDLVEVQPFTRDLGEYVSLRTARLAQTQSGISPEEDDAERALVFAVGWIARWEMFEHGYPADRVAERLAAIEPPITGEGAPVEILWATAHPTRSSSGRRYVTVIVQLANLPDRGRSDWGADMAQAWVDAAREARAKLPPFAVGVSLFGTLRVDLEPEPIPDADSVAGVLRRAVEIADQRYSERRGRADERERHRSALAREVERRIDAAGAHDVFASVTVEADVRHDGEHVVVVLAFAGDPPAEDLYLAAEIFRDGGGPLANAGLNNGRLELDISELSPDTSERFDRTLTRTRDELRRQRGVREETAAQYRGLAVELERRLGAPPARD